MDSNGNTMYKYGISVQIYNNDTNMRGEYQVQFTIERPPPPTYHNTLKMTQRDPHLLHTITH
jgi:hypothetical protein